MAHYSTKEFLLQLFDVPIAVTRRFRSDRLTRHAAALSFSSMLALAPMVAIAFSVLSLFSSFEQFGPSFEKFIFQFLVPTAGEELRQYVDQFAAQAGKLSAVGFGFFFLTALLLLLSIEQSFNDIWRVKEGRSMTSRMTVYWALVSLGPLLIGASLSISTYVLSMQLTTGIQFAQQVQSVALQLLPWLFELLAFLLLYLVMPNVRVALVHALVGAFVASLLFELIKSGFTFYIVNFNSYEIIYGALSTLPIFLLWVYLSWFVALVGAEVVAVLQQKQLFSVLDKGVEKHIDQ